MSKPVGAFNGVTRGPVGGAFRGATPSGHPETARGLNERSVLLASMMLETDGLPTTCAGDFEAALLTLLDTKGCKVNTCLRVYCSYQSTTSDTSLSSWSWGTWLPW